MSDRQKQLQPAINRRLMVAVLLLAWGIWGCAADPNADTVRDPSEVEVIALDSTAPTPEADSVSFWAVVGKDREVEVYLDSSGARVERLLRLEVRHDALYRKPDGTRFHGGDSVLIIIRLEDPASLQFSFEPSGLAFNPSHPAELTVGYSRALDAVLTALTPGGKRETDLAIWRQEQPNEVFYRLESKVDTGAKEIEAEIPGFSKYAVAY